MLLDLMKKRRSVRKYQQRAIEPEKIELLKEAALLAPTSKNKREWEFIFVEDKDTLSRLSRSKSKGGLMIGDAALAVVVAADTAKSDVWIEDASIAGTYLHLMAEEIGLGSCWVQIRNRYDEETEISASENIRKILNMPDGLEVACIIAIGYKAEEPAPRSVEPQDYARIHTDRY